MNMVTGCAVVWHTDSSSSRAGLVGVVVVGEEEAAHAQRASSWTLSVRDAPRLVNVGWVGGER